MPQFQRYIGIDYSGVESADSTCKRLRTLVPAQIPMDNDPPFTL